MKSQEGTGAGSCVFYPADRGLRGTVQVPGDKSVSHRAVLLGAVNDGPVTITGFLRSADTLATVDAVRALGVEVEERPDGTLLVKGGGWDALQEPEDVIDVRNAGTLLRLLPGLVASRDFLCVLTGDASIRRRPMARVLRPLAAMGASVAGRNNGTLPPIAVRGAALRGMRHELAVASAQVKSCILLAGLRAEGETQVVEPAASRDHTERMIRYAGGRVEREGPSDGHGVVTVWPVARLCMSEVAVPADFSSAAFFLVGALLVEGSEVCVTGIGLNPTRIGLVGVLHRMGADLEVVEEGAVGPEPIGRVTARSSELSATDIDGAEVPSLIDELPLFLLAAAKARGTSRLRGAGDLRAKESDRLAAMAAILRGLGVTVVEYPDGLDVTGRPDGWRSGSVVTRADHRLAMVGAIAGAASEDGVSVDDMGCIGVSYPGFIEALRSVGGGVVGGGHR
jgi:3-phosphoshikimate 1-carboxyvinyltransferase